MDIIERDRMLLVGAPGSGKSQAIIDIALKLPNVNVYAIDLQDSLMPLLATMVRNSEATPDNLDVRRIAGAAMDAWHTLIEEEKDILANVDYGDWIAFDTAKDVWQLVQDCYTETVYQASIADYKVNKVAKAKQETRGTSRADRKALGFGGFESDDWMVIKDMYGNSIPRALSARGIANVIVTANEKTPAHWTNKDGDLIFQEANLPGQYKKEMVKPDGEGQLTSQVDVVLWLKHPNERKWTLSTLGKNRYRVELKDEDVTGTTVWEVFNTAIGRDPEVSPGKGE